MDQCSLVHKDRCMQKNEKQNQTKVLVMTNYSEEVLIVQQIIMSYKILKTDMNPDTTQNHNHELNPALRLATRKSNTSTKS